MSAFNCFGTYLTSSKTIAEVLVREIGATVVDDGLFNFSTVLDSY